MKRNTQIDVMHYCLQMSRSHGKCINVKMVRWRIVENPLLPPLHCCVHHDGHWELSVTGLWNGDNVWVSDVCSLTPRGLLPVHTEKTERNQASTLHSGKTPPVTRLSHGSLAHSSPLLSSEIEVTMLLLVVAPQLLRPTHCWQVHCC